MLRPRDTSTRERKGMASMASSPLSRISARRTRWVAFLADACESARAGKPVSLV
jgi:hypothetical protein